jgi:hypothetical protein
MKRQPMFGIFGMEGGRWTPFRWFDSDLDEAFDRLCFISSNGHWCIMEDEESKPIYESEKTEFDHEHKLFYVYPTDHWWNYRARQYQQKAQPFVSTTA